MKRKLLVKLKQLVAIPLDLLELSPRLIQEQRLDELQDILLGGVMRAELASLFLVHHPLEQ